MARSTGGPTHARKRKRVLKRAKGFRGGPGTIYRAAIEFTRKAGAYATRDRKQKKRHFRSLWVTRLSAALRQRGISYNRFIPAPPEKVRVEKLALASPVRFTSEAPVA